MGFIDRPPVIPRENITPLDEADRGDLIDSGTLQLTPVAREVLQCAEMSDSLRLWAISEALKGAVETSLRDFKERLIRIFSERPRLCDGVRQLCRKYSYPESAVPIAAALLVFEWAVMLKCVTVTEDRVRRAE